MKNKLFIFNLEMNLNSVLLSHNYLWAKEMSNNFLETSVVTHKTPAVLEGKDFGKFIEILSLGNLNKTQQIFKLFFIGLKIIKNRNKSVVFYHMAVYPAAILSPLLRFFRIRQVLWYSHSHKNFPLFLASTFVDKIVTASPNSFPIRLKKVTSIGHGIDFSPIPPLLTERIKSKILVLGRISKVKNIELLVSLVSENSMFSNSIEIDLYGPNLDLIYFKKLIEFSKEKNVLINYMGELNPHETPKQISKYTYAYNGMINSVDKSALEVTSQGCLLISPFTETIEISGMNFVYPKSMNARDQLNFLFNLTEQEVEEAQRIVMNESRRNNYYKNTISKITNELLDIGVNNEAS